MVAPPLRLMTVARFTQLLGQLQRDTPGMLSATLASPDGWTVASTLARSSEAERIAAMSSSISALAGALTRDVGHEAPERVVLESPSGRIVAMGVPAATGAMVLAVVASPAMLLGELLGSCNAAVQGICECALQHVVHAPNLPGAPSA